VQCVRTVQYSMVQYGMVQYSTAQHSIVQYNSVQHSTVQYSTVQYSTAQYSTIQYSTVQYSTIQYSTTQYSTAQHITVQYSTVQYSTVQYSTVQYSTVQYSTVQYSTVWYMSACSVFQKALLTPIVNDQLQLHLYCTVRLSNPAHHHKCCDVSTQPLFTSHSEVNLLALWLAMASAATCESKIFHNYIWISNSQFLMTHLHNFQYSSQLPPIFMTLNFPYN